MKRRDFIKYSSIASVPFTIGGLTINNISSKFKSSSFINQGDDNVLVLIRLNGGNDGLNTIIPLDQYSKLVTARENILLPQSKILTIEDDLGLHHNLSGIKELYEEDKFSIIQSVGYPDHNRSHFRSSDIMSTGSSARNYLKSGWVGRYLDTLHPNYPIDYPNEEFKDPLAISIGTSVSETCEGITSNYSLALNDPKLSFINNEECSISSSDINALEAHIDLIKRQSNGYATQLDIANNLGKNIESYSNKTLANQLKTVARLISGGLKTKIFVLNLNGFDTHSNQVLQSDPGQGKHAELLLELSEAINSFVRDLEKLFLDHKVLGLVYSEFGRPIKSNASLGTDHGDAGPMFLFGKCLEQKIVGHNPIIPDQVEVQQGLDMQLDYRSVFSSILVQWLNVHESSLSNIFDEEFMQIPLTGECYATGFTKNQVASRNVQDKMFNIFPNPFTDHLFVTNNSGNKIHFSLYKISGQLVLQKTIVSENSTIETTSLSQGTYILKIRKNNVNVHSQKLVKI